MGNPKLLSEYLSIEKLLKHPLSGQDAPHYAPDEGRFHTTSCRGDRSPPRRGTVFRVLDGGELEANSWMQPCLRRSPRGHDAVGGKDEDDREARSHRRR